MAFHNVYILNSLKWNRFYVGETWNVEERFAKHNARGIKSTKNGCPWELIWSTELSNRSEALRLERKIKKRGAERYLVDIGFY